MVTKDELSHELNQKLGTDYEWEKMKKDELSELNEMVDDGELLEKLGRHIVKEHGKEHLENLVEGWEFGTIIRRFI